MTLKQITALDQEPAGPAPAVPGPSSLTEAVTAATAIAGLHQGAAQTAMAERDAAERRASEARQEAVKQAEAARQEERGQATMLLQIVQQFTQANAAAVAAAHETQLALQKQVHEANVQAINNKVEALSQQFQAVLAMKDAEIDRLKRTVDSLSTKEGVDEWLTKILVQGKGDDPVLSLLGRLIGPAQNPADDPNRIYQTGIAAVEVEKAKRALDKEDQQLRHADERHQKVTELMGGLVDLVRRAPEWLPQVATTFAGSGGQGGPVNGVPNDFPQDMTMPAGEVIEGVQ